MKTSIREIVEWAFLRTEEGKRSTRIAGAPRNEDALCFGAGPTSVRCGAGSSVRQAQDPEPVEGLHLHSCYPRNPWFCPSSSQCSLRSLWLILRLGVGAEVE